MSPTFITLGISHWNCPLEVREKFSLNRAQSELLLKDSKSLNVISIFTVSTCNRTQLFSYGGNRHDLKKLFLKYCGNANDFEKYGFILEGDDAIQNLFEVSTGIDSQILGDLQIFSQVKEGVKQSKKLKLIHSNMDRLVQFVFQANKEVQSFTSISKGAASIAHAVALKIKEHYNNRKNLKITLYGTGEIGQRTIENLTENGYKNLTIINRTIEKAEEIARNLNCEFDSEENLNTHLNKTDVFIVATASTTPIISKEQVSSIETPKLLIDLSVPRNIDPKISQTKQHSLIDMDHLNAQADQTLEKRKSDIPKAKTIINLYKFEFNDWQKLHQLGPTIKSLESAFENEITNEINKYKGQYTTEEIERIKPLINSVVKKLSSKNIEYLRKRYRYNSDIKEIIEEMYNLD